MTIRDTPAILLSCVLWFGSGACSSKSESSSSSADRTVNSPAKAVEVHCKATKDERHVYIRYEIRNSSPQTIHIVDSKRMPYQLLRDVNTLVILHGVNPPRPDVFYNILEMPMTRALQTDEVFVGSVVWPMQSMHDHYGGNTTPVSLLHGTFQVRCEAGWWTTPITEEDRVRLSFTDVIESQHVAGDGPFAVTLP